MTTPAQKKANARYKKENYKRVPLNMRNDDYKELQDVAKKVGQPVNTYIKQAIKERMEREENC